MARVPFTQRDDVGNELNGDHLGNPRLASSGCHENLAICPLGQHSFSTVPRCGVV